MTIFYHRVKLSSYAFIALMILLVHYSESAYGSSSVPLLPLTDGSSSVAALRSTDCIYLNIIRENKQWGVFQISRNCTGIQLKKLLSESYPTDNSENYTPSGNPAVFSPLVVGTHYMREKETLKDYETLLSNNGYRIECGSSMPLIRNFFRALCPQNE